MWVWTLSHDSTVPMTGLPPRPDRSRLVSGAEGHMLDLVYLLGVAALFALIALIAKGVERL